VDAPLELPLVEGDVLPPIELGELLAVPLLKLELLL